MIVENKVLARALRDLKFRLPDSETASFSGICFGVVCMLDQADEKYTSGHADDLDALFAAWPEFSGSHLFPVPAPAGFCEDNSPWTAYSLCTDYWEGEYGAARRRLLDFCIDNCGEGA